MKINHILCVLGITCIKVKKKYEFKLDNVKMACLITQPDKHQQNEAKESFRKQHMAAVPLGRRMY